MKQIWFLGFAVLLAMPVAAQDTEADALLNEMLDDVDQDLEQSNARLAVLNARISQAERDVSIALQNRTTLEEKLRLSLKSYKEAKKRLAESKARLAESKARLAESEELLQKLGEIKAILGI